MILCSLRVESGNNMSLIEYERTLENTYKKKTAWNHFQAVSYLKFVIFNVSDDSLFLVILQSLFFTFY